MYEIKRGIFIIKRVFVIFLLDKRRFPKDQKILWKPFKRESLITDLLAKDFVISKKNCNKIGSLFFVMPLYFIQNIQLLKAPFDTI